MLPSKSFGILVGVEGAGAGIAVIADIAVIARNRENENLGNYANMGCPGMNGEGEGRESP